MQTADFVKFIVEYKSHDIPEGAFDAARDAVADTISVAVGGADSDASMIAAQYAKSIAAAPQTPIWGSDTRTAPAEAAFVNAVSGHVLDFDDSLPSLTGHPSNSICAAALAYSSSKPVSGRDLLAAYVIGLEVAGKMGRALGHGHYRRGWHITATVGVFSVAASLGRLMGLSAEQMANAFGIAAAQSSGMVRNFGTMTKPFQAGHAARAGYISAWLAGNGMTGATDILEGSRGFLDAYGDAESSLDIPGFGDPLEIFEPGLYVKRWPCCYGVHRGLAGVFELISAHDLKPAEITGIDVGFLPEADKALIHRTASNGMEGKFSIEYCAAAAVIDGKITLDSFRDEIVRRPQVQDMLQKVRRVPMPGKGSYSGIHGYTDVTVHTTRGAFSTRVEHTPGSPQSPMTPEDRRTKFFGCTTRILGHSGAEVLWQSVQSLSSLPNAGDLAELMTLAQGQCAVAAAGN